MKLLFFTVFVVIVFSLSAASVEQQEEKQQHLRRSGGTSNNLETHARRLEITIKQSGSDATVTADDNFVTKHTTSGDCCTKAKARFARQSSVPASTVATPDEWESKLEESCATEVSKLDLSQKPYKCPVTITGCNAYSASSCETGSFSVNVLIGTRGGSLKFWHVFV